MYCTNCGSKLKEKANFCINCGAKIKSKIDKVTNNMLVQKKTTEEQIVEIKEEPFISKTNDTIILGIITITIILSIIMIFTFGKII